MQEDTMLRALFDAAPVGQAVWDADLRYVALNPRLAEINGFAVDEHVGRTPSELLGDLGHEVESALRRVLATAAPVVEIGFSGETPAEPGVLRHWLSSFFPVGDGVGGVVVEDTARHQAAARAEALARASAALGSSMRMSSVLARLVDAVVPSLADFCAVHLVHGEHGVEPIAVATADPEQEPLARALADRQGADPNARVGPSAVARRGVAEINPVITPEDLVREQVDPEERELLARLAIRSAVILPLTARGAVLGSLTLCMGASGRRYTPELVEFAQSIAAGAALAIDNARLFAEQAEVARAFQRTLLPVALPEVPGVRLAARYRAAGRANEVGGDFYDVFEGDRGSWAFVIGDVVGKGATAAAIASVVRATLRAGVLRGDRPKPALELVDDALRRRATISFCSALHGRLQARGGGVDVELVVAGHPPPVVLRADGTLEEVEAEGTLLGVIESPPLGEALVRLAPGDLMLCFTDGATELRGENPWRGEEALREAVRAGAGSSPAELVERVEREALVRSGGELRDDLALLAIGAAPPHGQ